MEKYVNAICFVQDLYFIFYVDKHLCYHQYTGGKQESTSPYSEDSLLLSEEKKLTDISMKFRKW